MCVANAGEAALPPPRDCPQALGDALESRRSQACFHPLAGAPATRRDAVGCAASGGQTALEAGASFDEVEQLLLTNGGRQAPLARATATELFRPPSPQPPSLRTTSPAAVDEQPPSMRSPPPAQSQPRSAHEQPHSHTALVSCRASPNRRRPAQVRRRSSERVGESSATSRGAAPLGGGHEMDTYLRSLSDQARATHANAPLGPL